MSRRQRASAIPSGSERRLNFRFPVLRFPVVFDTPANISGRLRRRGGSGTLARSRKLCLLRPRPLQDLLVPGLAARTRSVRRQRFIKSAGASTVFPPPAAIAVFFWFRASLREPGTSKNSRLILVPFRALWLGVRESLARRTAASAAESTLGHTYKERRAGQCSSFDVEGSPLP